MTAPEIRGRVEIGDDVVFAHGPVQTHLHVSGDGQLSLGRRVHVAHGVAISCSGVVSIGDDSRIGPFVVIMDSDFHVAGAADADPSPGRIEIGRKVRLGPGVTILPGAVVGDGATVAPSSVVWGMVPAHAHVSGNPAVRTDAPCSSELGHRSVADLVADVFGLDDAPAAGTTPDRIEGWDSLGALRLLLEIEEQYGRRLDQDDFVSARTVGEIQSLVDTGA